MAIFTDLPDNEFNAEGLVAIEPATRKFVTGEKPLASTFNYYFRKLVKTVLELNDAIISTLTAELKSSTERLITPSVIEQVFLEANPIGTIVSTGIHVPAASIAGYKVENGIWLDTTGTPVVSPPYALNFKPKYGVWMPMLSYAIVKTSYPDFATNCENCIEDSDELTVTVRNFRDGNLLYFCRVL